MDWKLTKSLFIAVFLIMNIILLYIYYDKTTESTYTPYSPDEQIDLSDANVEVPTYKTIEERYNNITAFFYSFTKDDIESIKHAKDIKRKYHKIKVTLKNPLPIGNDYKTLSTFVEEEILYGEEYHLAILDEHGETIEYGQTYDEYPIYDNDQGEIVFNIKDNKVISYTQTRFNPFESGEEDSGSNIISAKKVIESLYEKQKIKNGDRVGNLKFGFKQYITDSKGQILSPSWKVTIERDEEVFIYYVDAIHSELKILDEQQQQKE